MQQSEKVKPSIVNDTPGTDVRVEMELDAHELISSTWEQPSKTIAEKTNWFRVGTYSLILGLCIALFYVWQYQNKTHDKMIELLSAPRMQVLVR